MNKYVVNRATRGLSEYLKRLKPQGANVLISYDTRNHSQEFAKITAKVFLDMGIDAYVFKEPTPVPVLSYAIRSTNADLGIMITASHNPKIYNGYKVYSHQVNQNNPIYVFQPLYHQLESQQSDALPNYILYNHYKS